MLRNYLIIAWRVLWNNKAFSAINISGLAIGMAAGILLFQYIRFEKSYDSFHEKADNIYRSHIYWAVGENERYFPKNFPGAGPMLKEEFSEVVEYVRFFKHSEARSACIGTYQPEYGSVRRFNEDQEMVYFADASVFKIFSFPLIKGSPDDVLKDPNTVALSESAAARYFGDQDPLGKIIHIEDWSKAENKNFMVTGVFRDVPLNSHLQFDMLISFETWKGWNPDTDWDNRWDWTAFDTYVLLNEEADPAQVEQRSWPFYEIHAETVLKNARAVYGESAVFKPQLQPIKEIHLNPISNWAKKSDMNILYLLTLIGIIILVIACINYINLSTANAAQRSGEVGMRKVMGSSRQQLIAQFITESIIINILAAIIALTLIQIVAPSFNQLIGKEVITIAMINGQFSGILLGIVIACILISGFYPAMVLSSFKPITSLKGQFDRSATPFSLRNLLIVIQFAASVILISSVYSLSRQLSFMNKINLGFNKEWILTLNFPSQTDFIQRMETFKKELTNKPDILNVTNSNKIPGSHPGTEIISRVNQNETEQIGLNIPFGFIAIDDGYLNTFGIELLEGRNFGPDENQDPDAVLINESAMKKLGFERPEDAINAEIKFRDVHLRVIGVVKDYYHQAPKWGIDPVVMQNRGYADKLSWMNVRAWPGKYLSLKIRSGNIPKTITSIQTEWERMFPEAPFDYFFLDDNYNIQYGQDQQEARIFGIFAFLAVIIACMGLFGLTLYATLRRTKEIGIRKVMGAPVSNILRLLTRESLVLLIISSLIAVPVSYWFVNNQLQEYANRIEITPWLFLVPILIVLVIALVTVAYQTIRAATEKPVNALRYE